MLHKKCVVGSKLRKTGSFKGFFRFHKDLINYLGTWFSISIKFDFETSLQRYECDYKEISVKLCISKKKKKNILIYS